MTTWLCSCILQSSLGLADGAEAVSCSLEDGALSVTLSPAAEGQLRMLIVFGADDLEAADAQSEAVIQRVVTFLAFTTCAAFRLAHREYLVDWSKGLRRRHGISYSQRRDEEVEPELSAAVLESACVMQAWSFPPTVERAMHWFAIACRSRINEDKFQYFFYVVEILASHAAEYTRVHDKCAKCRTELHCPACDGPSVHRPFPSQRIREFLTRQGIPEDKVDAFLDVRNLLMHGAQRDEIERKLKKHDPRATFPKLVNMVGKASRLALFGFLKPTDGKPRKLDILDVNTHVEDGVIEARSFVSVEYEGDPDNPRVEDLRMPRFEIAVETI